jgi:putative ABC transport system permease protein
LRSLLARRGSSITAVLGTAVLVLLVAASLMVSEGVKRTFGLAAKPDGVIVLRLGSEGEGNSVLDLSKAAIVLARDEIQRGASGAPEATSEVLVNMALSKVGYAGVANVQLRGIEASAKQLRPEVSLVSGRWPTPGTAEALVGARIRGRFAGLDLGGSVELRRNRPVQIVGVLSSEGSAFESEVWADREVVAEAFGRKGSVSSVRARVPEGYESFKHSLENDPRLSVKVLRESEYYAKQSASTATFVTALGFAVSLFFGLAAILGGVNTMHSAVSRRRREIGVLGAVGFGRSTILVTFLFESVSLAVLGAALGLLLALSMGSLQFSMMNFSSWSEIVFRLNPTPKLLLTAFLAAVFVGSASGILPALRAARMPIIAALRN